MLINLLDACDYLLVVLILLPVSNQRSLNADHLQRTNETAAKGTKSFSPLKKVNNFVDGQCPPNVNNINFNGKEEDCRYECSSDIDCTEDYKCCEDGCSIKCTQPWFPDKVVDWARSSSLNQVLDNPELPDENSGLWKLRGEPCSTSILDGLKPLSCPTNYVCKISTEGDLQLNIPNRGECVRMNEKSTTSEPLLDTRDDESPQIDTACSHKGERYKHKEKFRKDCNICVCHNGVVFCDNRPCPVKIGIPAAISGYEEQRQMSHDEYIDIDGEEKDTEDASGSSVSGSDERRRENANERETISLGNSDDEDQEMQKGGEGVQSGDEEIQSGDEGIQSGDEGIQSGDEEIQSGDEELQNENKEMQSGDEEVHSGNGEEEERNEEDRRGGDTVKGVEVIRGNGDEENTGEVNDPDNKEDFSSGQHIDENNSGDRKTDNGYGSGQEDDENYSGDWENDDDTSRDHEVNNGEDSDRKEINLQNQGLSIDQESSGDSGSHMKTEAPSRTGPSTAREKISTLTSEISTLALEVETIATPTSSVTAEKTTLASKTPTFSPEISSASPGVGRNKTTSKASGLPEVKTTEGIIRLEKSDYEPSAGSSENYSGDDEGSSRSSGEYGSTDEGSVSTSKVKLGTDKLQPPEQVYPDTIVLAKHVKGANQDTEFGFETEGSSNDVLNTASLKRGADERSEDSESRSIRGKKPLRIHKRRGQTREYFETTDDEH